MLQSAFGISQAPIAMWPLHRVIAPGHLSRTDNAAGVGPIRVVAPPGSYQRPAPHSLDFSGLDEGLRGALYEMFQQCSVQYGTVQLVEFQGALLAGEGSVVTSDFSLVIDTPAERLRQSPPGGFIWDEGGVLRLHLSKLRRVQGTVLLLKRPGRDDFAGWLLECAALLAMAPRLQLPACWTIAVPAPSDPAQREAVAGVVARLAPGVPVLEHPDDEIWQCERLLYPSPLYLPPQFRHPLALAALRAGLAPAEPAAEPPTGRLFLRSGPEHTPRLENEDDLAAIAEAHGFTVIAPATMPFAERIRLFHAAHTVVGVRGAGLTDVLFCRPGARCLVLSPGDSVDPSVWDLASHAGAAYGEVFGHPISRAARAGENPFYVDPAAFLAALAD